MMKSVSYIQKVITEIMMNDETDEFMKELFDSLKK